MKRLTLKKLSHYYKMRQAMKIAYFINATKSTNWGSQATSAGVEHLLSKQYPDAEFIPIDLPDLPFKKIKILRKYHENRLLNALLADNEELALHSLKKMNISSEFFSQYTHVCFNGEGAVHYKSGHLIRFMGLLYLAKKQGKMVSAINQTIDLNNNQKLQSLVSKIYNICDFVSVREPLSLELAHKIGIKKCILIPDAVYGLPITYKPKIDAVIKKYQLPDSYITITGSSALKRNAKSIQIMSRIIKATQEVFKKNKIVFMVNAKTDLYLANRLRGKYDLMIIESSNVGYDDAMAIFSNSVMLIGGRQHPNIFAYIYKVPYLGFDGNTFKNTGVAMLQDYPYKPLSFNADAKEIKALLEKIMQNKDKINFKKISIKDFRIF